MLVTIGETAELFKLKHPVIAGLVGHFKLRTQPIKRQGQAKGLDKDALKFLANKLEVDVPSDEDILRVTEHPSAAQTA